MTATDPDRARRRAEILRRLNAADAAWAATGDDSAAPGYAEAKRGFDEACRAFVAEGGHYGDTGWEGFR